MAMPKKISIVQWLAWVYALLFFTVVLVGHLPWFVDERGYIFGLFSVSLFVDAGHFLAALLAAVAAWQSHRWATNYFRYAMIPFGLDAIVGILFSRDITETGSLLFKGLGPPDFSMRNILSNTPHVITAGFALWVGWWLSKRVEVESN
jgi:hypothetical protein